MQVGSEKENSNVCEEGDEKWSEWYVVCGMEGGLGASKIRLWAAEVWRYGEEEGMDKVRCVRMNESEVSDRRERKKGKKRRRHWVFIPVLAWRWTWQRNPFISLDLLFVSEVEREEG